MTLFSTTNGRWTLLITALLVAVPFGLSSSMLTTAVFVVIAAIGATGLNILTGYAGQVSLGHAFFLAVGAYTFVLGAEQGGPVLIWLPVAGLAAAVLGVLVGPIALRLQGLYLAIVTLGLVFVGQHILFNATSLSGGPEGRVFPSLGIGGIDFAGDFVAIGPITLDSNGLYYFTALIVLGIATYIAVNVRNSKSGRAMVAVRDRTDVARLSGINVARTKIIAFGLSSFFGGVCGALYVSFVGYSQPGYWDLMLSIQFVAAIVVGGLGTAIGPLLGSIIVFALPTVLKDLAASWGNEDIPTGTLASLVYGLMIVAFLVAEPRGLVGIGARVRRTLHRSSTRTSRDGVQHSLDVQIANKENHS